MLSLDPLVNYINKLPTVELQNYARQYNIAASVNQIADKMANDGYFIHDGKLRQQPYLAPPVKPSSCPSEAYYRGPFHRTISNREFMGSTVAVSPSNVRGACVRKPRSNPWWSAVKALTSQVPNISAAEAATVLSDYWNQQSPEYAIYQAARDPRLARASSILSDSTPAPQSFSEPYIPQPLPRSGPTFPITSPRASPRTSPRQARREESSELGRIGAMAGAPSDTWSGVKEAVTKTVSQAQESVRNLAGNNDYVSKAQENVKSFVRQNPPEQYISKAQDFVRQNPPEQYISKAQENIKTFVRNNPPEQYISKAQDFLRQNPPEQYISKAHETVKNFLRNNPPDQYISKVGQVVSDQLRYRGISAGQGVGTGSGGSGSGFSGSSNTPFSTFDTATDDTRALTSTGPFGGGYLPYINQIDEGGGGSLTQGGEKINGDSLLPSGNVGNESNTGNLSYPQLGRNVYPQIGNLGALPIESNQGFGDTSTASDTNELNSRGGQIRYTNSSGTRNSLSDSGFGTGSFSQDIQTIAAGDFDMIPGAGGRRNYSTESLGNYGSNFSIGATDTNVSPRNSIQSVTTPSQLTQQLYATKPVTPTKPLQRLTNDRSGQELELVAPNQYATRDQIQLSALQQQVRQRQAANRVIENPPPVSASVLVPTSRSRTRGVNRLQGSEGQKDDTGARNLLDFIYDNPNDFGWASMGGFGGSSGILSGAGYGGATNEINTNFNGGTYGIATSRFTPSDNTPVANTFESEYDTRTGRNLSLISNTASRTTGPKTLLAPGASFELLEPSFVPEPINKPNRGVRQINDASSTGLTTDQLSARFNENYSLSGGPTNQNEPIAPGYLDNSGEYGLGSYDDDGDYLGYTGEGSPGYLGETGETETSYGEL